MKNETKKNIMRGIVLILASFFLGSIIADYIGKYLFLMWLIPLITIIIYLVYILKLKSNKDLYSLTVSDKNKINRWRVVSIIMGFLIVVFGSQILDDKKIILLVIGSVFVIFVINVVLYLRFRVKVVD